MWDSSKNSQNYTAKNLYQNSDAKYTEWQINVQIDTIQILSDSQLSLTTVGIFSDCDCSKTLFEADLINFSEKTPDTLTLDVLLRSNTYSYQTLYLYDTVGQVCTYYNESDFCGSRSLSGKLIIQPDSSTGGIYTNDSSASNYLVL